MICHGQGSMDPLQVVVFIEEGFMKEDGHYTSPRLAWYLRDGGPQGFADLLEIQSAEKATFSQLKVYPFAMPGNSLILRFYSPTETPLVLETQNGQEARRFIHGIRWVVARMAFNMVIGNSKVTCELLDVPPVLEDSINAMNDMTNLLVEKALSQHAKQLI